MANDLRIKIIGTLNIGATIGEINTALKGIEKKINKLKLNVELDDKISKTLADFSKAMENHKAIAEDLNKVIREEKDILKDVNGVTKELTRQYLKSGEIIEKVRTITDQRTKATKNETKAVGELIDVTNKLGQKQKEVQKFDGKGNLTGGSQTFKEGSVNRTYTFNKDKKLTGTNVSDNSGKELDSIRVSLTKLYDQGKITEDIFKRFNTAIDGAKNAKEIDKVRKALNDVSNEVNNKALQEKLVNNSQNLLRTHKKTVDTSGVTSLISSLKQIDPSAKSASNQLKQLETQLKSYQNNAREAARMSMSLKDMLSTALTKFPIWMVSATAFYAPLRALQDMVTRIIEIDTLMTDINRVMDMPSFKLNEMLSEAVDISDELGSKLTDVLKITGEFARIGDFSQSQLMDMTKTTQVLQNISDLDATGAVDTLTSAMLNFNIAAEDSVKIADQLNEVKVSSLPLQ